MSLTPRERPPGVRERRFDSAGQLAETLATEVHQQLATALRDRGVASLVVSGGRSPVPFFRKLSEARLPWEKVHVTLADERWVEPTDAGSNEGLVRRELLQGPAASATFIGLKNDAPTPQQGAETTWRRLGVIARPFDALILGMGEDGHTASLFPGSPGILQALDEKAEPACVGMSAAVAPNARMSLNLAALAQSRRAWLQIEGETKWSVYREAASLAVLTPAAEIPASRPVAAMLRLRSPGLQVFWAP